METETNTKTDLFKVFLIIKVNHMIGIIFLILKIFIALLVILIVTGVILEFVTALLEPLSKAFDWLGSWHAKPEEKEPTPPSSDQ